MQARMQFLIICNRLNSPVFSVRRLSAISGCLRRNWPVVKLRYQFSRMAIRQPAFAMPNMPLEPYESKQALLPAVGRHFVAVTSSDPDTVVVYQAYNSSIAEAATSAQRLTAAPAFRTDRMTWIKPGFLWMMYRSGWASKHNQECILAVHLKRAWLFNTLRSKAILSVPSNAGKAKDHDVVVQWDPDHDYLGQKLERRAVQIGLRGTAAAEYAAGIDGPAVVKIENITSYVCHMRNEVMSKLQAAYTKKQLEQELPEVEPVSTCCDSMAGSHNTIQGFSITDVTTAALLQQLLVPVEDVVQLDVELQSLLGML